MNGVGTDIGRAWEQVQGTGTSTTVDMPMTKQALLYEQAEKRAAAAEKAATIKAAMGKLGSVKPDWWHKHDQYLRDRFGEVQKKGIDIIASGKDPFVDIDFVKEWEGFQADANISKDQKARFDKWNTEMSTALPQEYTDESIVAKNDYFNADIETLGKTGITEPSLVKNSTLDLQAYIGKMADAAAADQKDITSEQWDQKFQASWADPAIKKEISQAYDRVFQAYPPETQALIDAAFAGNRMKYYEGLAQNAFNIRRPETDFNVTELVSKTAGIVGDVFTSYENDSGTTTANKNRYKDSFNLARDQAEVVFQGQKNKYRQFVSEMGITGKDDAEVYKKAVDLFGTMVYNALDKSKQTSKVGNLGGGSGDNDIQDWINGIRAKMPGYAERLSGRKFKGKYYITEASQDVFGDVVRIKYEDEVGSLQEAMFNPNDLNAANQLLEMYNYKKGDQADKIPAEDRL